MNISFNNMPSWQIVAVMSRIARHMQDNEELACRCESNRKDINDAIQITEDSVRKKTVDHRATKLSINAFGVAKDAKKDGKSIVYNAALCASYSAAALELIKDRYKLIESAQHTLNYALEFLDSKNHSAFEDDLQRIVRLGTGLSDDDPVPPEMLNFVYEQAVHEAGHAVAALLYEIPFEKVRIIYKPECDNLHDPTNPVEVDIEHLPKYCLCYAAGMAAEIVVFSRCRVWGSKKDRDVYYECKGNDFEGDVKILHNNPEFRKDILEAVADLLEKRKSLTEDEVNQVLKDHGVTVLDF
jgi:hypothetical protein